MVRRGVLPRGLFGILLLLRRRLWQRQLLRAVVRLLLPLLSLLLLSLLLLPLLLPRLRAAARARLRAWRWLPPRAVLPLVVQQESCAQGQGQQKAA